MAESFRDSNGIIKFYELEERVRAFLSKFPDDTFCATEFTLEEARSIKAYLQTRGYNAGLRMIAKTRTGIIDYRLDVTNGRKD